MKTCQCGCARLTDAEYEVLKLSCQGLYLKQIAKIRGSCTSTVENHKASVYAKSGVKNQTQLGVWAAHHFPEMRWQVPA